jgi:hypothetical protein
MLKKQAKNVEKCRLVVCAITCERAHRTRLREGVLNVLSCVQVDDARAERLASCRVPSATIR